MARDLEDAVLGGALAGSAAALLLVARNGLAPTEPPLRFALVLWGYHLLAGLALAGLLFALGTLVGLLARSQAPRRALLAGGALAVAALCAFGNADALGALLELSGPLRFRWLVPLAFAAAIAGLLLLALAPGRRRALRATTAFALGAALAALTPPLRERPAPQSAALPPAQAPVPGLVVIGIDGADWLYLDALIARGELPQIAALRRSGAWGALKTLRPTLSPPIWTTIATGRLPREHGVLGFQAPWLRGVAGPVPSLEATRGLGFSALVRVLKGLRLFDDGPIASTMRRVPAFWTIATLHRSPVAVVNWWATWPAEPVLGSIVSEDLYYLPLTEGDRALTGRASGVVSPASLESELAPLIMRPADVTIADARAFMDLEDAEFASMRSGSAPAKTLLHELSHFISMFETDRRVALHLVEKGRPSPPDLLVLFRLVDLTSHMAMTESELVEDHLEASPEHVRKQGRAVSEAYRRVDRAVGEILAAFGPANVVVVSDHGFRRESRWPRWQGNYNHTQAPPGVFIASGPAFRAGRVEGLAVSDILPLLAYAKSFALEADLAEGLRLDVFEEAFKAARPVRKVKRYGQWARGGAAALPGSAADEQRERLKALGYVQ